MYVFLVFGGSKSVNLGFYFWIIFACHSKRLQEAPKRHQEAPRRLPRGPKRPPRCPQEDPEAPKPSLASRLRSGRTKRERGIEGGTPSKSAKKKTLGSLDKARKKNSGGTHTPSWRFNNPFLVGYPDPFQGRARKGADPHRLFEAQAAGVTIPRQGDPPPPQRESSDTARRLLRVNH